MRLSETGEARLRGYLFVLSRSLRASLPREIAQDGLREVEAHLRESVELADGSPNEEAALARILDQLGSPLRVAQAYSAEMTVEEAVATGRVLAVSRALVLLATSTVGGFFSALLAFVGYALGIGLLITAVMVFVDPQHWGLVLVDGVPRALGSVSPLPPGGRLVGGLWLPPLCLLAAAVILGLTHASARRLLAFWHARLASALLPLAPVPRGR